MNERVVCQVPVEVHIRHDGQQEGAEKIPHRVDVCLMATGSACELSIIQCPALMSSDARLTYVFPFGGLTLIETKDPKVENQFRFRSQRSVKPAISAGSEEFPSSQHPMASLIRVWCSIPASDLPAGTELTINLGMNNTAKQTNHSIQLAKELLTILGSVQTDDRSTETGDLDVTPTEISVQDIVDVVPEAESSPMWLDLTALQHLLSEPKKFRDVETWRPNINARRGGYGHRSNQSSKSQSSKSPSRSGISTAPVTNESRIHRARGWSDFAKQNSVGQKKGSVDQTKKIGPHIATDLDLQKSRVSNHAWWKEGKEKTRWLSEAEGSRTRSDIRPSILHPNFQNERFFDASQPFPAARQQYQTATPEMSSAQQNSTGEQNQAQLSNSRVDELHGLRPAGVSQANEQTSDGEQPVSEPAAPRVSLDDNSPDVSQRGDQQPSNYPRASPIKKKRGGALFDSN